MSVKAGHGGSDSVRGEHGVHRVLDARSVERRAALEPHERAAVAVLNDRDLTRDEKALKLRAIEAESRKPWSEVTVWTFHHAAERAKDWDGLREATADVSDGQLFGRARAAEQRVRVAVERVSQEGDALAPKREERKRTRVQGRRYEATDA